MTETEFIDYLKTLSTDIYMRKNYYDETYDIEFKASQSELSKDFWKTYSSFANTNGGYIFLGIKQEHNSLLIKGVLNQQKQIKDMFDIAANSRKCSHNLLNNSNVKSFSVDTAEGTSDIIEIKIPMLSIEKRPLYLDDNITHTYIRRNEGDYLATAEELRRFILNASSTADSELLDNYNIDDLDKSSILNFKNIVCERYPSGYSLDMDNIDFLKSTGVFQIDRSDNRKLKLTLAGLLFLGKYSAIIQRLPHFFFEYRNIRSPKTIRWKDRIASDDFEFGEANLFNFYHIIFNKLRSTIENPFILDEQYKRKTPSELDVALQEALANMIIHANYLDTATPLKIIVDDLFYSFSNPGIMLVSSEQFFLGGTSSPRNNILISFFRKMGVSDRAGSGGRQIYCFAESNEYRLPDVMTNNEQTELRLWIADVVSSYPDFSEQDGLTYDYIKAHPICKSSDIEKGTALSPYKIHKSIKKLLDKKLIISSGKARSTTYQKNLNVIEAIDAMEKFKNLVISHSQK